jgi:fumarate reductase subunit D
MGEEKKTQKTSAISGDNVYAILSYLWILCLVPVLMKKENKFVRFHARQGLMLFIVEVGVGIVSIIPFLGGIIYIIGMIVCGLLSLAGIVNVLMGKEWKMPIISEWAEMIKI